MTERADRYPEVDALRAIAAIAVLGTHAAIFAGAAYPGSEVGRYAQRLEVGLTIFFVISGFLLYRPFVAARVRDREGPRIAAYAWRRLLRIAPAYWVALTLIALLSARTRCSPPTRPTTTCSGRPTAPTRSRAGSPRPGRCAWRSPSTPSCRCWPARWACVARRSLRAEVIALGALAGASLAYKGIVLAGTDPRQVVITPELIALPAYLDQFALGMGLAVLTVRLQEGTIRPPAVVRVIDRRPGCRGWSRSWRSGSSATRIGIGDRLFEPFSRPSTSAATTCTR